MKVWQKAFTLSVEAYRITKNFPAIEQYALSSQLTRAAVSVPANIAEGYDRTSKKEYRYYVSIAKGSLAEVETYFLLAMELGYITREDFNKIDSLRAEVGRMLTGLLKSI